MQEQLRHELFHLWMPNNLALSGEYSWFYEGFAQYTALKLGVGLNQISFADFLNTLEQSYNLGNRRRQPISLLAASKNRWLGENSSVYAKGLAVAFLFDVALLRQTGGKRDLISVLRQIYEKHKKPNKTEDGKAAILRFFDGYDALSPIIEDYVKGLEKLNFERYLQQTGIEILPVGTNIKLKVKDGLSKREKDFLDKLGYNNWRKNFYKMNNLLKNKTLYLLSAIIFTSLFAGGCGFVSSALENFSSIVGLNDNGTVIAQRAQIRSSYAVVAADLLEVQRGDKLQILEETDFEKVKWYRVRANDEEETEGWIEAQNVILGEILEKSKTLAEEFKNSQTQANGQLRAASNLRLTPEQTDDNILLKLDPASTFEIISWKYVPKAPSDTDIATNSATNSEITPAKQADEPEKLLDKYDVWYFVKLDRSVSPAPAGWLFGRQVELQVPSDIVFYQQNDRKFVTWQ